MIWYRWVYCNFKRQLNNNDKECNKGFIFYYKIITDKIIKYNCSLQL